MKIIKASIYSFRAAKFPNPANMKFIDKQWFLLQLLPDGSSKFLTVPDHPAILSKARSGQSRIVIDMRVLPPAAYILGTGGKIPSLALRHYFRIHTDGSVELSGKPLPEELNDAENSHSIP